MSGGSGGNGAQISLPAQFKQVLYLDVFAQGQPHQPANYASRESILAGMHDGGLVGVGAPMGRRAGRST